MGNPVEVFDYVVHDSGGGTTTVKANRVEVCCDGVLLLTTFALDDDSRVELVMSPGRWIKCVRV